MRNTWVRAMRITWGRACVPPGAEAPPYRISSAILRRRNHARYLELSSAPCPAGPTREEFAMRDTWT